MKNKRFLATALFTGLFLTFLLVNYSKALAWPWSKGSINGTVVDFDNVTSTLEGVKVTLEEKEESTLTDQFGEFHFKGLRAGTYTLIFKKPEFQPKTMQIKVNSGKVARVKIQLPPEGPGCFSSSVWSEKAAARVHQILTNLGLKRRKIAIVFYKKRGSELCELPSMVLRFATAFNRGLGKNGSVVVTRDEKQLSYLVKELKEQHQFRVDYDPATVARIGKKLGADTIIIGALLERADCSEPLINGTSVERQAYIPGLSINDILLKTDEAPCE